MRTERANPAVSSGHSTSTGSGVHRLRVTFRPCSFKFNAPKFARFFNTVLYWLCNDRFFKKKNSPDFTLVLTQSVLRYDERACNGEQERIEKKKRIETPQSKLFPRRNEHDDGYYYLPSLKYRRHFDSRLTSDAVKKRFDGITRCNADIRDNGSRNPATVLRLFSFVFLVVVDF